MSRQRFLTFSSVVAVVVAVFALGFPGALLEGKGVVPEPALLVWVREVGALILAAGATTFFARKAADSEALRAVLIGNAVLHFCLLPIELVAFSRGVITKLGGVAPNSLLHLVLALGFALYASRVSVRTPAA